MSEPAGNEGLDKTIHVRNIQYETVEDTLRDAFKRFGEVKEVRIISDYDPHRGQRLSRGFGFVEFQTSNGCADALASKDAVEVDGRRLLISPARPRQPRKRDTAFIGGIPKGTTQDDLKTVFAAYGPTDVRIIREDNETGRGFAFVTFDTEDHQTEAVTKNRTIRLKGEDSIVRFSRRGPRRNILRRAPVSRRADREAAPRRPAPARGARRAERPPAGEPDDLARRILIGNIAWSTTGQGLGAAFMRFGDIQMVEIESRKDRDTGEEVSLGRGFVAFKSLQGCQNVLDFKDPIEVDGRKLTIKPALRPPQAPPPEPAAAPPPGPQGGGRRPPRGSARGSSPWSYSPGKDDTG